MISRKLRQLPTSLLAVIFGIVLLSAFYTVQHRSRQLHDIDASSRAYRDATVLHSSHGPSAHKALHKPQAVVAQEAEQKDQALKDISDLDVDDDTANDDEDVNDESGKDLYVDVFVDEDEKRYDHREIFALTPRNREYSKIYFHKVPASNANIIPHPTKHDVWLVAAQHAHTPDGLETSGLLCTAGFLGDNLVCEKPPVALPLSPVTYDKCVGDMATFNNSGGVRDVRLFYGPGGPYVTYGAQSQHTCLGVWMQDARMLLDPFRIVQPLVQYYKLPTEISKPGPYREVESNFVVFWDSKGKTYVQYSLWPKRAFAKLEIDGKVSEDLAPLAANRDRACMASYMPAVDVRNETLQQATNSLSITLCERKDSRCKPNDSNTFIMHLINLVCNHDAHEVHEPYVVLFQQSAPFALHAISQRPLWVHGRDLLSSETGSLQYKGKKEDIPIGQTERFSISSISWRTHGQKYHGYIDDPLFLAIGLESSKALAIDVTAGDLLQDLDFC